METGEWEQETSEWEQEMGDSEILVTKSIK